MRIERITIEGFGHLRQVELRLDRGLNLIHGPNEAGKSTVWAFIRAVLFGFEARRGGLPRYEPPDGGPYGGELRLSAGGETLRVARTRARSTAGEVRISSSGGEFLPQDRLAAFLGGVSRDLFCQVFSINLDALADFEQLAQQSTVSDALFAAGIPGARLLPQARAALVKATAERFVPRGSVRPINALFSRLDELKARLQEIGDRPAAYFEQLARAEALDAELVRRTAAAQAATASEGHLRRLVEVAPQALEARPLARSLEADAALASFPVDLEARLSDWEEQLAAAVAARADEERRLRDEEREVARLSARRLAQPRAEALQRALSDYDEGRALALGLPEQAAALEADRRRVAARIAGLGHGLDEARLRALELGARGRAELLGLRQAVATAARAVALAEDADRTASAEASRAGDDAQRLKESIDALPEASVQMVARRLGALEEWREGCADRTRNLEQRQSALAALRAHEGPEEVAPRHPFPLPLWGALAATLAALGIAAWVMLEGPARLLGAFAAGALALALLLPQRSATAAHRDAVAQCAARNARRRTDRARAQATLAELEQSHEQLQRRIELAARAAELPADADLALAAERREALEAALQKAQLRAQREDDLRQALGRRDAAAQAAGDARARMERVRAEAQAEEARLAAFLRACALPDALGADQALELWSEASALMDALAGLDARTATHQSAATAARAREEALLGACAQAALQADSAEAARGMARVALTELSREERELDERRRAAADAGRRLEGLSEQVAALKARIAAAVARVGAADPDQCRVLAARARDRAQRAGRLGELELAVQARAGLGADQVAAQLDALGGAAAAAERLAGLQAAAAEELQAQERVRDARAEAHARLQAWEEDGEIRALRAEEVALRSRLSEQVAAYAVDRMALFLLDQVKADHERRHQPKLLQRVERLFEALTSGRYRRVFPAEEKGALRVAVEDALGRRLAAEVLSRGTREQLFLAFRIGLAQELAATQARLPLMLDDLLVNFDPERARAAVRALAEVSSEHQVIAFSCHPHVRELFAQEGAAVCELDGGQRELLLPRRTA